MEEKIIKECEFRSISEWEKYHLKNGASIIYSENGVPIEARYPNPIMEIFKDKQKPLN